MKVMTKNKEIKGFPSLPSSPQLGGDEVKSTENTVFDGISEITSQPEGVEGVEGLEQNDKPNEMSEYRETFSDKINPSDLPILLEKIASTEKEWENKDALILGSLVTLSSVMPNCFGIYDRRKIYPPFYLIISAPPASDKGNMVACRQLVQPIEKDIESVYQQELDTYQNTLAEYMAQDKATRLITQCPKEPPYRSLWIPANSSSTACYQALSDNEEWGLTLETEADTISTALESEYGNYSDGLRKAFHHEPILYRRRKDNEHVKIEQPRWGILLTCTPGQIPKLFKSFENGLGSRFVFYHKRRKLFWKNVFEVSDKTLDEQFLEFGHRYKTIYDELVKRKEQPMQVTFSISQQTEFNKFFEELQLEQCGLYGDDMIAFVRRLGLVCFRIAIVLSILRHEGWIPIIEPLSQCIVCDDRDFHTAMTIVNCLINHTAHVYTEIISQDNNTQYLAANMKMSHQEKLLYSQLGNEYTTGDARQTATRLGINWRTAERYLGKYASKYKLAVRLQVGKYKKLAL